MSIEGSGGIHVIVTGASSGIGEATARLLVANGCRVTLAARRTDKLEALAAQINPSGKRVTIAPTDVNKPGDLERLVERANAIFGRIDAVVNNAGVDNGAKHWWTLPPEKSALTLQTNLIAVVELTRLVLPQMLEHKAGSIINVGSVAGHIGTSSLYSASKFGLRGFSLSLRRELAGTGVHVSLVSPGFIRTPLTETGRPMPMPGPEIVAKAIQNLLDHPRAETVVPGWYRFLIFLENAFPLIGDRVVAQIRSSKVGEKL